MKIEHWAIEKVKPYPRNPRILGPEAIAAVADSLKTFGWRQPIVVDGEGVIVVGHMRHAAALSLGYDEVPLHVADLTEDEARAYRLADNSTGDMGKWDHDLQQAEMREIAIGELGLDWENLGLSLAETIDTPGGDFQDQRRRATAGAGARVGLDAPGAGSGGGEAEHECPACGFQW